MRYLSLLFIASLSVAHATNNINKDEVDDTLAWVNSILDEKNNSKEPSIDDRFTPGNDNTMSTSAATCYMKDQSQGVCVEPEKCSLEKPKIDPTTLFGLREKNQVPIQISGCNYLRTCCPEDKVVEHKISIPTKKAGCGWSNPGVKVFRAKPDKYGYADFGDFPWMVALIKKVETNDWQTDYLGGGALIHPSVVLTVAHKVNNVNPSEIKCRAGEYDSNTIAEVHPHQERNVKKIVVHPEYESVHVTNNVALLFMEQPFDMADAPHMGEACLSPSLPPPGTECYSMGWGQDIKKSMIYANILKKIRMPLVEARDCENRLRNTVLGQTYTLHPSLTCAGGEAGIDTCKGDGGSPLVCPIGAPNNLRFQVVGLVVYGVDCGKNNVPGVYLNVPHVYEWIGKEMVIQGFPRNSYVF